MNLLRSGLEKVIDVKKNLLLKQPLVAAAAALHYGPVVRLVEPDGEERWVAVLDAPMIIMISYYFLKK